MKKICIGTMKGGAGKTSFVYHQAGILAERGHKILLLDLDPQANLTTNFGIMPSSLKGKKTISDVLLHEDEVSADEVIVKTYIDNIDIIPGTMALGNTEHLLTNISLKEQILVRWFTNNHDRLKDYQLVLMDTNPSFSFCNQTGLFLADSILLVANIDINAFYGISMFSALWRKASKSLKLENTIKGLIINSVDSRTTTAEEFTEVIRNSEFKDIEVTPHIPINVELNKAVSNGKPINLYNKKSKGYEAYNNIADELTERGVF